MSGWTRDVHEHRTAVKAEEARLRKRLHREGLQLEGGSSNAGTRAVAGHPPTPPSTYVLPSCADRPRRLQQCRSPPAHLAGLASLLAVAAVVGTRVLWDRDGRRLNGRLGVLHRIGDGVGGVAATAREQLALVPWLRGVGRALQPGSGGGHGWGHTPGDEGRRPPQRRRRQRCAETPGELAGQAAARRAAQVLPPLSPVSALQPCCFTEPCGISLG